MVRIQFIEPPKDYWFIMGEYLPPIKNWTDYYMAHAIMSTKFLGREEVQRDLYNCYRIFFGSWRRIESLVSKNKVKRKVYRYMVKQNVLRQLNKLF